MHSPEITPSLSPLDHLKQEAITDCGLTFLVAQSEHSQITSKTNLMKELTDHLDVPENAVWNSLGRLVSAGTIKFSVGNGPNNEPHTLLSVMIAPEAI